MQEQPMAEPSPTISIRLPTSSRRLLDKAVKATRRSRSFLMKEALDRYLDDIVRQQTNSPAKPLSQLLSMRGIGRDLAKPRTAEEIDADIRWLRDGD
jgi:Arc/MetJ-type ribon-helix-helix transcriptional regulator